MNKFIRNIDKVYSIILSILTIAMDKHWILFMVLLLLNVLDTLTGWIKSRINNKENSMAGLKGIAQWILVLLSFIIPVCFEELGKIIHIDLAILTFLGWYVLISLIINEYRSILENLVEAGFYVPQILVKGLEVASQNIESIVENNE